MMFSLEYNLVFWLFKYSPILCFCLLFHRLVAISTLRTVLELGPYAFNLNCHLLVNEIVEHEASKILLVLI